MRRESCLVRIWFERFPRGLVFQAHRLFNRSTLGSRVIKKEEVFGSGISGSSGVGFSNEEQETYGLRTNGRVEERAALPEPSKAPKSGQNVLGMMGRGASSSVRLGFGLWGLRSRV